MDNPRGYLTCDVVWIVEFFMRAEATGQVGSENAAQPVFISFNRAEHSLQGGRKTCCQVEWEVNATEYTIEMLFGEVQIAI